VHGAAKFTEHAESAHRDARRSAHRHNDLDLAIALRAACGPTLPLEARLKYRAIARRNYPRDGRIRPPHRWSRRDEPLRRSSAPPSSDFAEKCRNRREQGGDGCNEGCMVNRSRQARTWIVCRHHPCPAHQPAHQPNASPGFVADPSLARSNRKPYVS